MVTIVTLHHNTWPLHVQRLGNGDGMLADAFPDRFAEYARQVATTLGDLIDYYVTINEPDQLVYGFIKPWWTRSYAMPPGLDRYATTDDQMDAVSRLIPNLFRAHARAGSRPGCGVCSTVTRRASRAWRISSDTESASASGRSWSSAPSTSRSRS